MFAVDEVWPHPGYFTVAGRVYEADVCIGDVFTALARVDRAPTTTTSDNNVAAEHPVTLRVDGIEAYQHSVELLSSGVTGLLKLTGLGEALLQMVDPSEGIGLWVLTGAK
ncbi:hypothetical protein Pla175_04450 [Pirellulimonas nuda]|uniref:Uncharacterized protein n=1 Tax=Pirellulimonas nuda TaxID=2528009 RepID=A0A518D6I0_9BACT|nr:hypothetical protein [Pirellulimonas nuda]QDU87090.1 hypothetical protein Pla175_04450 [Pirellulimonas nuda]